MGPSCAEPSSRFVEQFEGYLTDTLSDSVSLVFRTPVRINKSWTVTVLNVLLGFKS